MPISLLITKLHIPLVQSGLISRTRLLDRMYEGVNGNLTLISAPAGFGKTTLLGEWIGSYGKPLAWLSLEREDNDPGRFWTYILAAFRTIQPDLGKDRIELQFTSPQSQIDFILTPLINEIAALPDPLLLILDDYHVIDSSSIQEGMIFLLEHMPTQLHLVIASRSDPAWPLAHWRTRGQLVELRAADLRFTPEEAADFLKRTMKLNLSIQEIAALEERTEGWIAGLQMAALSLQGREDAQGFIKAFTGSNRFVLDYLVEEVLGRQPMEVQEILLKTSVLEHMSASLCDAILDRNDSRDILYKLEQANLFLVPLDEERQWYRYHHLFADILSTLLKQTDPGIVPGLHLSACAWYEDHGFLAEAMTHALAAGNLDRLARLVEQHAFTIMNANESSSFLQWLSTLPDHLTNSYPWLNIARAWLLAYLGMNDRVDSAIRAAEVSAPPEGRRIWGYIAAMRTLAVEMDSRRIDDGIIQAGKALELLPQDEFRPRAFVCYHLANMLSGIGKTSEAFKALEEAISLSLSAGDIEMAMTAQFELAAILRSQGKLRESLRLYEKTLLMPGSNNPARKCKSLPVGYADLQKASIYLEWNVLEKALYYAQEGLRTCKLWGYSDFLYNGWYFYSSILYETGDWDGALNAINEAKRIFTEALPLNRIRALEAVINLAKGDSTTADAWIRDSDLKPEDIPNYEHRMEYYQFARILIAQGKLEEAYQILERLQVSAEKAGASTLFLHILTQQVMIIQELGYEDKALSLLQHALGLAEPEGFIRVFINKGPGMERLLIKAIASGIHASYAKELLVKFRESTGTSAIEKSQSSATADKKIHQIMVEPLSEREMEILHLLESSMNTPEIARELYISVGTVRTHIKNIYRKLNVNRRMEAIQHAKELGLL